MEVFAEGGAVVITDIIFPDESSQGVELFAEGGSADFTLVRLWRLGSYRDCPEPASPGLIAGLKPFWWLPSIFGDGCPR